MPPHFRPPTALEELARRDAFRTLRNVLVDLLALSIVYHIVGIFDLHTHHTLRCPQIHNPGTGRAGLTKTDLLWLPRGEQAEAGSDADTELTSYSCSLQFHEVRY